MSLAKISSISHPFGRERSLLHERIPQFFLIRETPFLIRLQFFVCFFFGGGGSQVFKESPGLSGIGLWAWKHCAIKPCKDEIQKLYCHFIPTHYYWQLILIFLLKSGLITWYYPPFHCCSKSSALRHVCLFPISNTNQPNKRFINIKNHVCGNWESFV